MGNADRPSLPPSNCTVPDNGAGAIDYPPNPCGYVTLQPMMIVDGLPAGTTIDIESMLDSFFDITYLAGGMHGGEFEHFSASMSMEMMGSGCGMPSPGHTTLTIAAGGGWAVDRFFDITYRIDFVGHPGGPLGGMSGSTTGTIRMQCGIPGTVAIEAGTWGDVKAIYR
jgi:hypothetical protein